MSPHSGKSSVHSVGMEPARAGFHKIVTDILKQAPAEDAALIGWRLVCGAAVSQRTTALAFTAGVLRVEVPDATWRAQLRDLVPQYLVSLNLMVNAKVERIEFVLPDAKKSARPA